MDVTSTHKRQRTDEVPAVLNMTPTESPRCCSALVALMYTFLEMTPPSRLATDATAAAETETPTPVYVPCPATGLVTLPRGVPPRIKVRVFPPLLVCSSPALTSTTVTENLVADCDINIRVELAQVVLPVDMRILVQASARASSGIARVEVVRSGQHSLHQFVGIVDDVAVGVCKVAWTGTVLPSGCVYLSADAAILWPQVSTTRKLVTVYHESAAQMIPVIKAYTEYDQILWSPVVVRCRSDVKRASSYLVFSLTPQYTMPGKNLVITHTALINQFYVARVLFPMNVSHAHADRAFASNVCVYPLGNAEAHLAEIEELFLPAFSTPNC